MRLLLALMLTFTALLGGMSAVWAADVVGVRSYRAPDYTRLVFDLAAPLQFELQQEAQQIVLLLKGASYDGNFSSLELAKTPIMAITSTVTAAGDLQVTLTLRQQVDPKSFALSKNAQYGDRLVIDLYDEAQVAKKTTTKPKATTADSDPIGVLAASLDDSGERDIVVAVSAGHGGDDPGAIGHKRLQEKNVTLALARATVKLLNAKPGFKAVLLRDGDYYVGLREQVALARKHNADLFIAIHADAAENKDASGATVYALSQSGATSEQARMLADKENKADLIGGVGNVSLDDKDEVLASVLLDLSMTGSVATSLEIGNQLVGSLAQVTKLHRRNVEQAAFVVLKSADMPSLLIESGYITNPKDADNLNSPKWQQQFAGAMAEGITEWFSRRPPRGTLLAAQQKGSDGSNKAAPTAAAAASTAAPDNTESKAATRTSTTGTITSSTSKNVATSRQQKTARYTVQRGDSLSELAVRFNSSMADLKAINKLKKDSVQVGQVLKVPAPAEPDFKEHKIKEGETLSEIASSYEVSLAELRESNQLKGDNIRPGQILKIPTS